MISFLKKILANDTKKKLIENVFSLSVLQGANYLLPLITLPYLVRVLGPEKWGLITFAQAFIQYFIIFTDYGFNLSATREIALHRDNHRKTVEIFNAVMVIKFGFMLISLIVLTFILFSFEKFYEEQLVYFFTFGMILGNILFPVWFFQGIERMKYITFLNILLKSIFTISIFIFVHETADYYLVPLLNTLGYLTAGLFAIRIIRKDFNITFTLPKMAAIRYQLITGWHTFISGMAISMSTITNTFFLGILTNDVVVGYYTAAEKVYLALVQLFTPIFQTLYPHISQLAQKSRQAAITLLNRTLLLVVIITSIGWVLLLMFSGTFLQFVLGNGYQQSIIIFQIFSPLFIVIPIAYIFFNLSMLPFKLDRYFSRIYLIGGLLNLVLLFIFLVLLKLNGPGAALASLINQILITGFAYIILRRKKIKLHLKWSKTY